MPLISVIVPVYNVEKYLKRCVDSVLTQNFRDIEVILSDDGSSDSCPAICDAYAAMDERVKVIHKENGGLSDARNAGIHASKGKYLLFLDSDDFWENSNSLEQISQKMQSNHPNGKANDIILYGCKDCDCLTNLCTISRDGYDINYLENHSQEDVLKYLISSGKFPGSAWIVAIRRELVLLKDIFFEKGIKSEDVDWLIHAFLCAESFSAVNDSFYIYLKGRSDSITGTANAKSVSDLMFIMKKWEKKLDSYGAGGKYLKDFLAYHYCCALIIYSNLDKQEQKMLHPELKEHKHLLQGNVTKKVRVAACICNVLGIPLGSKVLSLYHQCKSR